MNTACGTAAIVAVVRELWETRDDIAQDRDVSPGRVLPDAALVEIAMEAPTNPGDLPGGHRAIAPLPAASGSTPSRAPTRSPRPTCRPMTLRSDGPPPARVLGRAEPGRRRPAGRHPGDAHRVRRRSTSIPVENVLSPDPLRRVIWQPPADRDEARFHRALLRRRACRHWQAEIVAPMLVRPSRPTPTPAEPVSHTTCRYAVWALYSCRARLRYLISDIRWIP